MAEQAQNHPQCSAVDRGSNRRSRRHPSKVPQQEGMCKSRRGQPGVGGLVVGAEAQRWRASSIQCRHIYGTLRPAAAWRPALRYDLCIATVEQAPSFDIKQVSSLKYSAGRLVQQLPDGLHGELAQKALDTLLLERFTQGRENIGENFREGGSKEGRSRAVCLEHLLLVLLHAGRCSQWGPKARGSGRLRSD